MAASRTSRSASTQRKSSVTRRAPRTAAASTSPATRKKTVRRAAPKPAASATNAAIARPAATARIASDSPPVQDAVASLQLLALENAGKLASLQLNAWRRYADALLTGCRELSDAGDTESLANCLARQPGTVRDLALAATEDFDTASRIGMETLAVAGDIMGHAFNRAA